ncbi:MAG TPA: hydrogenase maturation protease [Lacibacter sp.]|nr:hydrogenase maturation protease [Lacibacter sp.]HMO89932.1 hydrogenase maturation protease [Lacibacter sp.]HMP86129.1 hydrogenase maturation protease [Lacibacter sp.]
MHEHVPDTNGLLLIGIGNTARGDDGLGWALADAVDALRLPGVTVEYRYQLQVEDALLLQQYPRVIFADASHDPVPDGAALLPCDAAAHYFFSSHHQSPATILYLAETLYGVRPQAWVLAMGAEGWELGAGLSERAQENLTKALELMREQFYNHIRGEAKT